MPARPTIAFSAILVDLAADSPSTAAVQPAVQLVTLALTSQALGRLLVALALPRLPAWLTSIVLMVQPVGPCSRASSCSTSSPRVL